MEKVLNKGRFGDWVARLDGYRVYAPAKNDGVWTLEPVDGSRGIGLDHPNTVDSPKSIVFPQREVFFDFEQTKGQPPVLDPVLPDSGPTVIFGVRPCDAKALTLTDKVFGGELEDPYYWTRRNRTLCVGLACNKPPSANCFCLSVHGSPHSEDGLDILMTELADKYHVKTLTKKGEKLVGLAKSLFKAPGEKDRKELKRLRKESVNYSQRPIDGLAETPAKLKEIFETPFWEDQARACIKCGICTFLCPTCHCFDINDEVTRASPLRGQRVRTWDTCQFPDFTMHSSGHNPRPDNASRMRQRICHKFLYFFEEHQANQCTGCGRCVSQCPVGIDIVAVLDRVAEHGG